MKDLLYYAQLVLESWRPVGTPAILGYDPPFTLPFLRRSEVAVRVAAR
jgi:hypothetical protein